MAVVKGPLFSVGASGTVAGAVVYSVWKGRPYVRQHAVPANPRSGGQLSMRAMLKFLAQYWDSLSSAQQTDWNTRAAVTNVSPFNAFVSYNQLRWGTNLNPSKLDPATSTNTPGTLSDFNCAPGSRSAQVNCVMDANNDNWGIKIFRGLAADMGVTRNELVQIIPAESIATHSWLDFPLTPNVEVFYRCIPITDDGLNGVAEDDIHCVPTA